LKQKKYIVGMFIQILLWFLIVLLKVVSKSDDLLFQIPQKKNFLLLIIIVINGVISTILSTSINQKSTFLIEVIFLCEFIFIALIAIIYTIVTFIVIENLPEIISSLIIFINANDLNIYIAIFLSYTGTMYFLSHISNKSKKEVVGHIIKTDNN